MITWSAHLSTLFQELPPDERPAAAAAAGFTHVETWWPPLPDLDAWCRNVRDAGLVAACVNADGGDLAAGERGFCNVPERAEEAVAAAVAAARAVTAAGGDRVNLLVGRRRPGVEPEADLDAARATVVAAARAVAPLGVTLVIEHLNPVDVEEPLLPTPAAAAAFVRSVGEENVRVLFDAYHAAAAGLRPADELVAVVDLVGHVQYADHPGRGAPGTGTVSPAELLAVLDEAGYGGAVGLEFVPGADTASALGALIGLHQAAPFGQVNPQ